MKYIWLAAGCLFLGFGLVGVVLPILPTTPFILVAVFCFAKSSERMHRWLLSTQLYQKHVKKFNETRTMTLKEKITILAVASVMLLAGFYFSAPLAVIVLLLFLTVVPLSVMGAASFSLALSRQGKNAGSASALIGCFSMLLGACMMPLVGIAGDHTAIPMGIIMLAGYSLGWLVFRRMIAVDHLVTH